MSAGEPENPSEPSPRQQEESADSTDNGFNSRLSAPDRPASFDRKGLAEKPADWVAEPSLSSIPALDSNLSLADPDPDSTESDGKDRPDLARGIAVLQDHLKHMPSAAGVYRMLNNDGDVLYVGKARNLKKRVVNYTRIAQLPNRLRRMVAETRTMEVVTTHTEVEALLLESNYIKKLMPRYNILLRDDKTFPHILLRSDHDFPQLVKHRGAQNKPGEYFGPFASASAVNRTLTAIQKGFLLRPCSDAVFKGRNRPCLQYQIKRCSAPCVDRISKEDYAGLVRQACDFFHGRSTNIQEKLVADMQEASDRLDFETAARYRDRLRALTFIQQNQDINVEGIEDADIMAAHEEGGQIAIEVFFFRGGRNYGSRAWFPGHDRNQGIPEVLAAFIAQFYENKPAPPLLLLSEAPDEQDLLCEALSLRAGRKVKIEIPQRGNKRKPVEHALVNAREALGRRLAESASQRKLLDGVARVFGLEQAPERIEVYDNSHIQGTNAVGAMIVAGPEGFMKSAYRKFNIRGEKPEDESGEAAPPSRAPLAPPVTPREAPKGGDDFAMMREMIRRRFERTLKEDPDRESKDWPDLLLIDGGKGQLGVVLEVMEDLGVDDIPVVGIAKGPDRDAGRERFFLPGREAFTLEPKDPVLYFLQRLRDESHRFVIGAHRSKRAKQISQSALDEIPGIGAARKKALLLHFGSAREVERAGLADLEKVNGISAAIARKIYDFYHQEG